MRQDDQRKLKSTKKFLPFVIMIIVVLAFYSYSKANTQIIRLNSLSGPIVNPLMGWAPWATIDESNQPHTLVYADLTWRDFEPREGNYDFEAFENRQQLDRWRREGKRVIFRFVADRPGSETHLDIPEWLFLKIDGSGDYYDNDYGKGFSPNYSNHVLIEHHRKVIQVLGERYGKDDFFAFIELGSLGHWGEWHTHPDITPLPSENIRNLYVYHYIEAFPETPLLMRRPFSIAREQNLGLYNDMTADPVETNTWLNWIEYGGEYLLQETQGLVPMPDGWRKAPIGGEQAPTLQNETVYGTNLQQTLQLLKWSHTTFIGPNGPYAVEQGSPLQSGLDQVLATIGYRIHILQAEMARWIRHGKYLGITITFSNHGLAPMYHNWPTRLYLWDEQGHTIATQQYYIDFKRLLPGESCEATLAMPVGNLKNGTYSIGIAIIDPLTGLPSVRLANENARNDLIQYIGSFEVRRLLNPN